MSLQLKYHKKIKYQQNWNKCHYNWNITKKWNVNKTEMLTNWNVSKTEMSPKLDCHQNEMSPKQKGPKYDRICPK